MTNALPLYYDIYCLFVYLFGQNYKIKRSCSVKTVKIKSPTVIEGSFSRQQSSF